MSDIDKLREADLLPDEVEAYRNDQYGETPTSEAALNALASVAWEQHEQLEEARSAMPDGDYWSGVLHRKNVEWMKDVQRANDAEKKLAAETARADDAATTLQKRITELEAENERLTQQRSRIIAGFNTYQLDQHELDCDERDHEVAIFDAIANIIFARHPSRSEDGGA